MEKFIPVYYNDHPWFNLNIKSTQKFQDIKNVFSKNPELEFVMMKDNKKSPFTEDDFDNAPLEIWWNELDGISIIVTKKYDPDFVYGKITERSWTKDPNLDMLILINFSPTELQTICQGNRYIASLCRDHNFWRNKIVKDFPLRGKYIYHDEYIKLYKENPRELYKIINEKSKIINVENYLLYPELKTFEKETLSVLGPTDDKQNFFYHSNADTIIMKNIQKYFTKLPLLRGDILYLKWLFTSPNGGKIIWNGEKFVPLKIDSTISYFPILPEQFTFPEFPLDHFFLEGINAIWLSPLKQIELRQNYQTQGFYDEPFHRIGYSVISDNYGRKYKINFVTESKIIPQNPLERNFIDVLDEIQKDGEGNDFVFNIFR